MNKEKIGMTLIILGVLTWPVGIFLLDWKPVPNTLAVHLSLVIPGVLLKGSRIVKKLRG